ncbi:hypothetical protein D1013_13315 [Euzebyella marina]|uniref:Uncharacterized protein n=1 Tax=Euzebyella marina TaxID=1761453 RepID=A0A3G2L7N3_9FLAO|nr:hypothetical protein [Euzebyella marina]AYN68287.1 hypothetical protein D1013_13315 [Euzebyella marina]
MKNFIKITLLFFVLLVFGAELQAQYGYGYGSGYGYGYGRQRNAVPQVEHTPKEPEPKTAEQIVDGEMPKIAETLELNEFESAVLSSILKKYVQKRIEMQILELTPEQMREGMEKITKAQDEELKAGLPLEKYEGFVEMQKKGIQKTRKDKKREKKRKDRKTKT